MPNVSPLLVRRETRHVYDVSSVKRGREGGGEKEENRIEIYQNKAGAEAGFDVFYNGAGGAWKD